jgi:hypothetical protein
VISPSQRPLPDNTQHSQQTNIHATSGIRSHDLSRRAAVDLCLRPRGHWDRLRHLLLLSVKPDLLCSSFHLTHTSWVECCIIIVIITNIHSITEGTVCGLCVLLSFRILIIVIVIKNHNYYYYHHCFLYI